LSSVSVAAEPPNIILILTDDQRAGTLQTMPVVRHEVVAKGMTFTGAVPTSTCCPSRSSLLSGRFSHTTGVYANVGRHGGWKVFNSSGFEAKTFPVALQSVGYRTALFGKYLNGWVETPDDFVPPGWDEFMAIRDRSANLALGAGAYYNYDLTGTQTTMSYGSQAADYSTDVIVNRSVNFVQRSIDGGPFFLMTSVFAPHDPFTPAPRHVGAWSPRKPYDNAAVNEIDMSDKSRFLRELSLVPRNTIDWTQTRTGQALMAVDEGVEQILDAVEPELPNTLVIYMSDNGVMWGEHRLLEKYQPYRWSTEVPLIMRWDGHLAPSSEGGLATNVDVTASILEAAGATGALDTDGLSMLSAERSELVLEGKSIAGDYPHPAYCGVRTMTALFVDYDGKGAAELYDYQSDPLELTNVAKVSDYQELRQHLKSDAKLLCVPTPPGFKW
jgi:arylsulfatase A-like enzyme